MLDPADLQRVLAEREGVSDVHENASGGPVARAEAPKLTDLTDLTNITSAGQGTCTPGGQWKKSLAARTPHRKACHGTVQAEGPTEHHQ